MSKHEITAQLLDLLTRLVPHVDIRPETEIIGHLIADSLIISIFIRQIEECFHIDDYLFADIAMDSLSRVETLADFIWRLQNGCD